LQLYIQKCRCKVAIDIKAALLFFILLDDWNFIINYFILPSILIIDLQYIDSKFVYNLTQLKYVLQKLATILDGIKDCGYMFCAELSLICLIFKFEFAIGWVLF